MDGSRNRPARPDIPVGAAAQNSDVPPGTETATSNDQTASLQSLSEALGKLYAETWLFAIIVLAISLPLLFVIALLTALWHLNMCMGNLNPPWYTIYMAFFRRSVNAAIEVVIELVCMLVGLGFMLLDALNRVFIRELLSEPLVIVPLSTIVLYGMGVFPGGSDLLFNILGPGLALLDIRCCGKGIWRG
jgi:hypothetical protein